MSVNHNTVHLWRLQIEPTPDRLMHFIPYLSPDECQRAERFYFDRDRHRFILTRGWLRTLLGHYLHCHPAEVQFAYGDRGKPALTSPFADCRLQFNLSHSQRMALFAITCDRQVGVDIEHIRELQDVDHLAQKVLSEQEYKCLETLNSSEKVRTFLTYWTCKEAYVKALGAGLSISPDTIEVAIAPGAAKILSIAGDSGEATRWTLSLVSVATDYVAALVVEGRDCHVTHWDCLYPI